MLHLLYCVLYFLCFFMAWYEGSYAYTKKIQVTRWIFHGIPLVA